MNIENVCSSWKRWFAGLLVGLLVTPVLAHHSATMFDNESSVTLAGTVKEFQWTNPHCWIQVLVPDKSGPVEWSIEMGSPSQLFRGGWKPKTVQVGDKIVVVIHPMRDGTKGGLFVSATRDDGTQFGNALK
jgi:hypothetical protein